MKKVVRLDEKKLRKLIREMAKQNTQGDVQGQYGVILSPAKTRYMMALARIGVEEQQELLDAYYAARRELESLEPNGETQLELYEYPLHAILHDPY